MERLNWEIEIPETPENIRKQLLKVKGKVETLSFGDQVILLRARELWKKEASNFTRRQIALNKNLKDAVRYSLEKANVLGPYWSEFLYGKVY